MGADSLAKNTTNALKILSPSPKVWNFQKKKLSLGVRSPWFGVLHKERAICQAIKSSLRFSSYQFLQWSELRVAYLLLSD